MGKLVIMRGCSGSGKSTKAREIAEKWERDMQDVASAGLLGGIAVICSTDEFFVDPESGKYAFDLKGLTKAHAWNLGRAHQATSIGVGMVVIDNTNTQRWEFEAYLALAKRFGYEVEKITVGQFDESSLKVYANRNKHKVPLDTIRKQANRFEK